MAPPPPAPQVLSNFRKLPLQSAKRYTREVTEGLRYLHNKQIVHRDVKPQNVLLGQDGVCKLADFGTASVLQEGDPGSQMIVGTPYYMAPETVRGGVGKEGDVWALGVTLWQMLTGELVLVQSMETTNDYAVLFKLGTMTVAPTVPDQAFPEEVAEFLKACWQLEPSRRATTEQLLTMEFMI